MNNLLSKTLICGVIATSFLLINCQKAPNRPVKSGVDPLAKPQAASMTACTPNMLTSISERAQLVADVEKLIKEDTAKKNAANGDPNAGLDDASKAQLQAKINELAAKSNALYSLIESGGAKAVSADPKALPPAGKFGGCNEADPKDPKKSTPHVIDDMKASNEKLARITMSITGQSNDILDNLQPGFAPGKSVKISAELAAMLSSKANLNGAKMIVEGKVLAGGADYEKMVADKSKTSCVSTMTGEEDIAADSTADILGVSSASRDDKSQRMKVNISMNVKKEGAASVAVNLACNIAEGADASAELSKALSALMAIVKAPTAPAPSPSPAPAPAPGEPAPAPAPGEPAPAPAPGEPAPAPAPGEPAPAPAPGEPAPAPAPAPAPGEAAPANSDISRAMEIMRK